jgi:hypothetical protein
LAVIIYSIDVFHMTAMTVLAILWDKETLGYFAFAFKIFQICVSLFPFLIQEVMRTRMYYNVAAAGKGTGGAGNLVRPILAYGFITIAFWQVVFWWAPWAVAKCVPTYIDSVPALIILTLALMPLGVAKICTDFLCSRSILKSGSALKIWGSGIALQALLITFWPTAEDQILRNVPLFYLISALWIYFASFISVFKSEYPWWPRTVYAAVQCLVPVFAALAIVRLEKSVWHWIPGGYWLYNLPSFAVAIALSLGFAGLWVYAWTRWRSWNPFPQHF